MNQSNVGQTIGNKIMSNQDKLANATVSKTQANSFIINLEGTTEAVQVTQWDDHLAYTGAYGNAIIRINGAKNLLDLLGNHSSDEYIAGKVVTSDMGDNQFRKDLMYRAIRLVAEAA